MEEATKRQAFLQIKPLCDALMKEPSVKAAIDVADFITNSSAVIIQDLMEYILYPTIIHIQNTTSKDTKLHLVNIIKVAIKKTKIKRLEFFSQLHLCLMFPVYSSAQPNLLIPAHEELKESVVECLRYLFLNASLDVIESFYTRENAARLSQNIYICLSIAKTEKSSALRIAAIEALMALTYVHDQVDPSDTVLMNQVAEIIMLFLPGIVKGLQDIYQGNEVQNHKVTLMAVRALGRIVALVMGDLPENDSVILPMKLPDIHTNSSSISQDKLSNGGDGNDTESQLKSTVRSQQWLCAASEKLQVPLRNLINLTKHSHFKVRKELIETVTLLLSKCSKNLSKSFGELIEILISLSEDDNEEVSESAKKALNQVNEIVTNYRMRSIVEVLEERFYKLLTQLPRIIRRSDDATQLSHLNQLIGYLRLLGKERLPQVMTSVAHLRRLLLGLVYIVELDCSGVTILEENQLRSIEDVDDGSVGSWKRFKFIRESTTEDKLILVCQLLGDYGDITILVDSIFELINDMSHYRKELILLLNWILTSTNTKQLSLYQQIIDFYTEPEFWYLPIQVQDNLSLGQIQSNVVQSCLLTEGLGLFASVLQCDYQKFLLKTLYLIIERAGSGHGLISHVGLNSLIKIAKSQGYADITQLIRANVDYFSYHVTIKLRRVEKNPGVLNVVSVVMKYSTLDVLPCLNEIVQDALVQLGVNFQQANAYSLLKVLYTFTVCIRELVCSKDSESNEKISDNKDTIAEQIIKSVLEYCEAKKVDDEIENDNFGGSPEDILKELEEKKDCENFDYNLPEENDEKKPPQYVSVIESVMKRCLHFLPSKDISKTLLAMQTLKEGLEILASWTDQLLPIVHELWHPLVDRFKDPNILIINNAWQLLYTLSRLSEDFIRSRTLKEVSPAIAKFLDKAAHESYNKTCKDAYKFTQMFKLQKLLLSQLGTVARYLKLQERELWNLLTTTEVYLNCHQHPELQKCCIELYKSVTHYNGDIVWVKCLSLWNRYVRTFPIDRSFSMVHLKIDEEIQSDYRENVREILIYIDEITNVNNR